MTIPIHPDDEVATQRFVYSLKRAEDNRWHVKVKTEDGNNILCFTWRTAAEALEIMQNFSLAGFDNPLYFEK